MTSILIEDPMHGLALPGHLIYPMQYEMLQYLRERFAKFLDITCKSHSVMVLGSDSRDKIEQVSSILDAAGPFLAVTANGTYHCEWHRNMHCPTADCGVSFFSMLSGEAHHFRHCSLSDSSTW